MLRCRPSWWRFSQLSTECPTSRTQCIQFLCYLADGHPWLRTIIIEKDAGRLKQLCAMIGPNHSHWVCFYGWNCQPTFSYGKRARAGPGTRGTLSFRLSSFYLPRFATYIGNYWTSITQNVLLNINISPTTIWRLLANSYNPILCATCLTHNKFQRRKFTSNPQSNIYTKFAFKKHFFRLCKLLYFMKLFFSSSKKKIVYELQ